MSNLGRPHPLLFGRDSGYEIGKSLLFNSADSSVLRRTPTVAGSRTTWTWAGWVKRSALGALNSFWAAEPGGTNQNSVWTFADDELRLYSGSTVYRRSSRLFRDIAAHFHLVLVLDTTNAVEALRARAWVDGEAVSWAATTAVGQNSQWPWNAEAVSQVFGANQSGAALIQHFNGYFSEVHFIDGLALDPTYFGYRDPATNQWRPKKYTGPYGTNGFYLDFSDPNDIGKDRSGNGNDWTPVNLDASDVMADTPTNNFCTLNPLNKSSSITLSDGNLRFSAGSGAFNTRATFQVRSGKWYWEYTATSAPGVNFGVVRPNVSLGINAAVSAGAGNVYAYNGSNGNKYDGTGATGIAYGPTWSVGDTIGAAFDADEGTIEFFKNGVSLGVAFSGIAGGDWDVFFGPNNGHGIVNFGQRPFAYDPPAGFLPLCAKSLPAPLIENPRQYFDVVTYPSGVNGVDVVVPFAPDLVWTKVRNAAFSHLLTDSVRGSGKTLSTNTTNPEANDGLITLGGDGFHLATTVGGNAYVAWNWKRGALPGFDIVPYSGTGVARYIRHGLGVAPSLIIVKSTSVAQDWFVYHAAVGASRYLKLNTTDGLSAVSGIWASVPPASTEFYLGSAPVNQSGQPYIAYLFAEVPGFSKFGSYTGNGNEDGPFVHCGFRPAFLLRKRVDAIGSWHMLDSARSPHNVAGELLLSNFPSEEGISTGASTDFLSNGFKMRGAGPDANAAGGQYIYAAFAEFPFKYANAR